MRSVDNGFNSADDKAAIAAEAAKIVTEIASIQTGAKYKGIALFGTTTVGWNR